MIHFFKKQIVSLVILFLPFIYLAYEWNSLPQQVPIHWNHKGEIDNWGSKVSLIWTLVSLLIVPYFLMLIIPKIDPKNKLATMGGKYEQIKLVFLTFLTGLTILIIYSSKNEEIANPNSILILMGLLFIILGNYFKVIKQNYFIGIKTPWTLENEQIWKMTHRMAGKLWIVGGLLIVILCLILPSTMAIWVFLTITILISLIPVGYSYFKYKEMK